MKRNKKKADLDLEIRKISKEVLEDQDTQDSMYCPYYVS
jgi:hypothetical protein